ncbi:MAG: DUF1080 domain-containing protein [Bryobacteraceae bacterium]|nr:DUF1080 domain-containing protein [Bryobacteraceae bacterium]
MRHFILAALLAAIPLMAAPKPLFNGKTLDGWKMTGPGRFAVENGNMATEGGMGLLYYERESFADCMIRVVYATDSQRANSGVVIRLPEPPTDPWYGVHNGYEVQIDAGGDDWHSTGAIYSISKVTSREQKPRGEWNTMEIELRGAVTRIRVNGKLVNEYTEGQPVPERKIWYEPVRGPRPNRGYIGLQNHDANSRVLFKEVSVHPLP